MSTAISSNVIVTDTCCGVYVSTRIVRKSLLVIQPQANRFATVAKGGQFVVLVVLVVPVVLVVGTSSSAGSERYLTMMSRSSSSGSPSILSVTFDKSRKKFFSLSGSQPMQRSTASILAHCIRTHLYPSTRTYATPRIHIMAATSFVPPDQAGSGTWNANQTQEEFMRHDNVILVSPTDSITGHASKHDAHRFDTKAGLLHRAFSVFLFDADNRLLLQQRAASKITFDSVWTNTCCSHPLYGNSAREGGEVDDAEQVVATGHAPGAARAAIRKLHHELGIDPSTFRANGEEGHPVWGEHEMDYILFHRLKVKGCDLALAPHPEEVMDTRWVTRAELKDMMREGNGLRWSPWFRIIERVFLPGWWEELDEALRPNSKFVDGKIHEILG